MIPDFLEKCYAALIYFSLDKEFCIDLLSSFRTHLCNPGFKDSIEYNFLEILGPLSPLTIDFTTDCHTPSLIIRVRTLWSCLPLNDT